jgi:hypothetical protein
MIAGKPGEAGYNAEQDYWWTRRGDVLTRYTIAPSNTSASQDENRFAMRWRASS